MCWKPKVCRSVCINEIVEFTTVHQIHFLSGEISAFKEQCFCNFEYLLAKMHATSVQVLLTDLEVMQTKLLDAELYLVAKAIRESEAILTEDTLQLASELIGQLRKIRR
jgi:hypothetical protein